MESFNLIFGLGIIVFIVLIIRLLGAWILRINDVIIVQNEILAKIKNTIFITLLVLTISFMASLSQAQSKIDSLKQVIATAKQDTNKVNTLNSLASEYIIVNLDSSLIYAEQALQLSTKLINKKGMSAAYYYIGVVHYYHGDYTLTIENWQNSLKISEELANSPDTALAKVGKKGMSSSYKGIGLVYNIQGSYDKALSYQLKSLKISEELGDKKGMSGSYINIGIVYQKKGSYDKALSYYLKSLKNSEELGDKRGLSYSYNSIGTVHYEQGSYDKAILYYLKSLKTREELGDKQGMAISYGNIGNVHSDQGSYDKALLYYLKSLKIYEELGDKQGMATSYGNIGIVHKFQGSYNDAISYFLKTLKIFEELGDKNGIAVSYINIADLNLRLADSAITNEKQRIEFLSKAAEYANKSYKLAKEIGSIHTEKNAADNLMDAYTKLGNYKKAIEFAEIFIATKDSLINEEQTKELAGLEAKYEYEKQKAIDDANNEKLLAVEQEQRAKQKVISYAIAGGLVLAVIFLIFVFNRLKHTRKQKRVIEKQKKQVDEAYNELEEKNKEILDSINYAKRIQTAILPPAKVVKEYLQESFIIYKPKDIVAGDFYWLEHKDGKILFAAADCTGHGVPGAMVSVVCNNGLNRSVREHGLTDPGQILGKAREIVIQEFEKSDEDVKDGMDIALCSLDGNKLEYAGANNPLWIIRKGEIIETKANKQPIGKFDNPLPYTTHSFELQKGDSIYIFSDGYVDQFGGKNGKKFKVKAFRELLLSMQDKAMEEQKLIIDNTFENWRGKLEQIDDVCIIGVKI